MSTREHGISPWRTAYELLVQSRRNGGDPTESVSVKTVTVGAAAGTAAVDVIAYRQDGESLQECADRANTVYEQSYRTHNAARDNVTPFGSAA